MERSNQLKALYSLGKEPMGLNGQKAECTPEIIWLLSRREKTCLLTGTKSQFLFHPSHSLVTIMTGTAPLHICQITNYNQHNYSETGNHDKIYKPHTCIIISFHMVLNKADRGNCTLRSMKSNSQDIRSKHLLSSGTSLI